MKAIYYYIGMAAAVLLSSCKKDTNYDMPDPDYGKITVTADWSGLGTGVDIPASWTVCMGDYTGTETGKTHTPDYLFTPGSYTLVAYNIPEGIAVSGTTATVADDEANSGCISGTPSWLFTSVQEVEIAAGTDYALTAAMRQQVRELTLVIEPTGDAADLIESIEGYLSGVAGTLEFDTDMHGTPSDVALSFTKITEGNDAGKWHVTVRLLGIAGSSQTLTATITYAGGNPQDTMLKSDMTAVLADFNADKTVPLTLTGSLETPDEVNFTAPVIDWIADNDYYGDDNGEAVMK